MLNKVFDFIFMAFSFVEMGKYIIFYILQSKIKFLEFLLQLSKENFFKFLNIKMSNENIQNNSLKMTESNSRNYTNEETNNENIVKILPGKHQKLIEEKEDNSIEISKNPSNKRKKQCNKLHF